MRKKNLIAKTDREKRKREYIFYFKFRRKKGVEENSVLEKEKSRKANLLVRIPICTSRNRPAPMLKLGSLHRPKRC